MYYSNVNLDASIAAFINSRVKIVSIGYIYLVYLIFFVILSVVLVPLVKKAVFVAIYGVVVEIALTKPTCPFRKALTAAVY